MQPPSPLYHPPGQPFTIWTRKVLGLAIPEPARYHLLGRQFTVWTRSLPRPEPAPEPKLATPPPVAAVPAAKVSWAGRASMVALPVLAGAWWFDHQQSAGSVQSLQESNQRLTEQAATSTKSLEDRTARLADLESKMRNLTSERDLAMQSIKSSDQVRKATEVTLQTKIGELARVSAEVAALKKQASEKAAESAKSLTTLRAEFSKFKQAADQKEADMQKALAMLEVDKATAINEAAKAASEVRDLTSKLEKAAREAPPPPAEPKP